MENKYESLRLDNQICFPLYAASKEIIRKYRPYLEKLDLTYTQYIAMLVLWEQESVNVKELGAELFLDSGTLTPVLKSLQKKGLIVRKRDKGDERVLIVGLTAKGAALKDYAVNIPKSIVSEFNLEKKEALELYRLLYKILNV